MGDGDIDEAHSWAELRARLSITARKRYKLKDLAARLLECFPCA